MFSRIFQSRARVALSVVAATLFFAGSMSMAQTYDDHGAMLPGCALMTHTDDHDTMSICPMSLVAHFATLQAMFTITLEIISTLALLFVIAYAIASGFLLCITHALEPPNRKESSIAILRLLVPPRNLRLQEAFARGILHSRAYER